MACTSCHDPHGTSCLPHPLSGRADAWTRPSFTATVVADGIGLFFGPGPESNTNHNAYHSGYSAWCATCHGDFHNSSGSLVHPSGETMDADEVTTYNLYNGTTDCIANAPAGGLPCGSGVQTTAYLAAVPFEDTQRRRRRRPPGPPPAAA